MPDLVFTSLLLGFMLGLSHALDADHLVAVGTLTAETESLARSSLLGLVWGIGHTVTLAGIGTLVLSLKWQIPSSVATNLEVFVAGMIVILGGMLVWRACQPLTLHVHTHAHQGHTHSHLHVHAPHQEGHTHHHVKHSLRKAFVVGVVHGAAGSAALTLTVMTTMPSLFWGLFYIVMFGVGTMAGMFIMSAIVSLPFVLMAHQAKGWKTRIQAGAGIFAMGFGGLLAWSLLSS